MKGVHGVYVVGKYVFLFIFDQEFSPDFNINGTYTREYTLIVFPISLDRELARFPRVITGIFHPADPLRGVDVTNGGIMIVCEQSKLCSFVRVDEQGRAIMKQYSFFPDCMYHRVHGSVATYYRDSSKHIVLEDIDASEQIKSFDVGEMKIYKDDAMFSTMHVSTGDVYFVGKKRLSSTRHSIGLFRCRSNSTLVETFDFIEEKKNKNIDCRIEWMSQNVMCVVFKGYFIVYEIKDGAIVAKEEIYMDKNEYAKNFRVIDNRFVFMKPGHFFPRGYVLIDVIRRKEEVRAHEYVIDWPGWATGKYQDCCPETDQYVAACMDYRDQTIHCWLVRGRRNGSGFFNVMHQEGNVRLFANGVISVQEGIEETNARMIREVKAPVATTGKISFGPHSYALSDVDGWKSAFAEMKDFQECRGDYYSPQKTIDHYGSFGLFLTRRPKRNFDVLQTIQHFKRKNRVKSLPKNVLEVIYEHVKKTMAMPKIKL